MSASDKKKLRKEQKAAVLSERQQKEQKEAKKLRIFSIAFIVAMVLIVCLFAFSIGSQIFENSGYAEKHTIAAVVGDRELNTIELSYYYNDAVSKFYNEFYEDYENYTDSYLMAMGLDTSKPLDEQIQDEESGKTWSTFFVESAIEQAKIDYALCELAEAEGFTLPEEEQTSVEEQKASMESIASIYGFNNADDYLEAAYCKGASVENYIEYTNRTSLAQAYYAAHEESITYDDAAIRAYEADKVDNFNSYDYSYAYLSYSDFILGGTPSEDGKTTNYTDEEKAAARVALKAAAEEIATATTLEEMESKAEAAKVNETSKLAVNDYNDVLHTEIDSILSSWLVDPARQEGDIAAIPNALETEDGSEVADVNGYYVIYFKGKSDNKNPLGNVRHLLVKFENGETDEETGQTVYSEESKNAAKTTAEGYLKTWQEGEATEESFIQLVKDHSDDSSAADGGLFEDIHPRSEYVKNFLDWSIDPERKAGDAGVIETEYGYHVMYYVGDDELTYRDYMITNEMRTADQEAWYEEVLKDITTSVGDTSKMRLGLTLSN